MGIRSGKSGVGLNGCAFCEIMKFGRVSTRRPGGAIVYKVLVSTLNTGWWLLMVGSLDGSDRSLFQLEVRSK